MHSSLFGVFALMHDVSREDNIGVHLSDRVVHPPLVALDDAPLGRPVLHRPPVGQAAGKVPREGAQVGVGRVVVVGVPRAPQETLDAADKVGVHAVPGRPLEAALWPEAPGKKLAVLLGVRCTGALCR